MRNTQFATCSMGVAETSPSVLWRDGEGTYKLFGEPAPIALNGLRLRGSTHGYTSWRCTKRRRMPNTCAWHRRGRLEYYRWRLKLTPRTPADSVKKTLQEHPRSCKDFRARPTGLLARPHRIAQQPGGKKVPSASVSICGILTDTPADAWGQLSGRAIRVPQTTRENPLSFAKYKTQTNLKRA
jgi:hypothetical protein